MLILTHQQAYEGLCAADRKGDFRSALRLASVLIRGFETGRGVRGFPKSRIPLVVELERKARRQYREHYDAARGAADDPL